MNKKLIVVLVVIVVLAAGAWAFVAMQPQAAAPENGKKSSNTSQGTSQAASAEITYTDNGFSPNELTVKVGSTIKIKNTSSGPLQFSSNDHPTHTKDPELNMASISAGDEGTLEVTRAGTWGYHNHLKSSDTGTLTVTE